MALLRLAQPPLSGPEVRRLQRRLTALGYGGLVRFHVGEAVQALRDTPGVAGVHLMAPGNMRSLPIVLENLRMPAPTGRS